ncbi:MAG: tyrosine-type recombinase/integrase, partial [Candidatus Methanospirareceae archaeon]
MACEIYNGKMKIQEESLLARASLAEEDKALITRFVDYKIAESGITKNRATKLSRTLRLIGERYLGGSHFQELTREATVRIVAEIAQSEDMKEWTRRDYKLILRMFLVWLGKDAAWIKSKPPRNDLRAEEMLSREDVSALIDAANTLRDKALIASLYEGGFRIAELAMAQIKDVKFDTHGAVLIVNGKTGLRRVRLISSVPHLQQWLAAHPLRDDRDAPLWVDTTSKHQFLKYDAIRVQLQKIAKRAGIKKSVNPHNFRHSRASYLASRMTESQLEEYLGWEQGSTMARTYVHLSGRDLDECLLQLHGLESEQQKEEPTVKRCPFCNALNEADCTVCHNCKRALSIDVEDTISLEEQLRELQDKYEQQKEDFEKFKAEIKSDNELLSRVNRAQLKALVAEVLQEQ